jgi:membrane-associated phospholipid phosphatase
VVLRASGYPADGAFGALIVVAGCALLNRVLKVSLHAAFAVFAAALVGVSFPFPFAVFALIAAAVAWSRVALGRHSRLEVMAGVAMGALGGVGMLFW